jgi:hypothetical protein
MSDRWEGFITMVPENGRFYATLYKNSNLMAEQGFESENKAMTWLHSAKFQHVVSARYGTKKVEL